MAVSVNGADDFLSVLRHDTATVFGRWVRPHSLCENASEHSSLTKASEARSTHAERTWAHEANFILPSGVSVGSRGSASLGIRLPRTSVKVDRYFQSAETGIHYILSRVTRLGQAPGLAF